MLHVERHSPERRGPAGPDGGGSRHADPVILLHGFTQSGAAWEPVTRALVAGGHHVVTPDAPGHGGSAGVAADLWESATLIVEAAGAGDYVGYSMGARMALHVALAHPEAVHRLVLVSGTGGIDGEEDRAARRAGDEEIARRIERDGVAEFVEWWLRRPLFATLPPDAAALDSRLGTSPAGLAASLRLAGTGSQAPLWGRLGAIEVPTLVVVGELDAAYRRHGERLVASIGANAALEVIPGAGHAVPLERPDRFAETLAAFLG
ncbi:MAG: alpha/beta fold hydrolase [Acidimicrobiaceae bacterium]|nr:alpha/beta fold hydrolase [Acidimicrobiaceae bacterium]